MTTSRLPMIPTHVMGSHGFPGWFWTALDKIKAGRHASSRRGPRHHPSAVWTEMEAAVVFGGARLMRDLALEIAPVAPASLRAYVQKSPTNVWWRTPRKDAGPRSAFEAFRIH
jgi:hypothetical protein